MTNRKLFVTRPIPAADANAGHGQRRREDLSGISPRLDPNGSMGYHRLVQGLRSRPDASLSVEAIPEEWRKRLAAYERIHGCTEAILRVRAGNQSA